MIIYMGDCYLMIAIVCDVSFFSLMIDCSGDVMRSWFVFGDGMKGSTSLAPKQGTGPWNGLATAQELQYSDWDLLTFLFPLLYLMMIMMDIMYGLGCEARLFWTYFMVQSYAAYFHHSISKSSYRGWLTVDLAIRPLFQVTR